ncbi:MAG: aspartate kinase [Weeksellaceae bacterium]
MKVFKFGGASVKDSESVRNLLNIMRLNGNEPVFIVVSAMGKTTNALEDVVKAYFETKDFEEKIRQILHFHFTIIDELFEDSTSVKNEIQRYFEDLKRFLYKNKSPNYDFVYDQVVCTGELVSTKIVSSFLKSQNFENQWIDVRDFIKTDDTYREGKVNWKQTRENFLHTDKSQSYVTQGFLGSDANFFTTTLGREGSDYTAAIAAYCLDAESMTIWKDVPGVLNADPRYFENAQLLHKISYEEAIELAYYGASVIHPKTMQPLRNKEIPFFVKSFMNPGEAGTQIQKEVILEPFVPCYILKKNQNLLILTTRDFSFITEDKISRIFSLIYQLKIKVNLMQNSAITLSLCLEDKFSMLESFMTEIKKDFEVETEKNVSLYTVRNYIEPTAFDFKGKELLRQIIKNTLQIIIKE